MHGTNMIFDITLIFVAALIGGFIAMIDGRLYDASLLTKTEQLLGYLTNRG